MLWSLINPTKIELARRHKKFSRSLNNYFMDKETGFYFSDVHLAALDIGVHPGTSM